MKRPSVVSELGAIRRVLENIGESLDAINDAMPDPVIVEAAAHDLRTRIGTNGQPVPPNAVGNPMRQIFHAIADSIPDSLPDGRDFDVSAQMTDFIRGFVRALPKEHVSPVLVSLQQTIAEERRKLLGAVQ